MLHSDWWLFLSSLAEKSPSITIFFILFTKSKLINYGFHAYFFAKKKTTTNNERNKKKRILDIHSFLLELKELLEVVVLFRILLLLRNVYRLPT